MTACCNGVSDIIGADRPSEPVFYAVLKTPLFCCVALSYGNPCTLGPMETESKFNAFILRKAFCSKCCSQGFGSAY